MKRLFVLAALGAALLFPTATAVAAGKTTVAVLPFTMHSAENIGYIQQGIWDMLLSRIAVPDRIAVAGKEATLEALGKAGAKGLTAKDAAVVGKALGADYVVWGSLTKIGASISIDGRLFDLAADKPAVNVFSQAPAMDEVIPKINDFALRIGQHLLGTTPPAFASAQTAPVVAGPPAAPPSEQDTAIITALQKSKKGTLTATINPDFISAATPIGKEGFWMSQPFPTEFKGMDIGDVNGDGLNEIVLMDSHCLYIYQKKGPDFLLVQRIDGPAFENYLAIDVADINDNGIPEIIVTNINGNTLNSFVLEFRDGKFVRIAEKLRFFFRVVTMDDAPLLLGQQMGFQKKPFDTEIYRFSWDGSTYVQGRRMKIPKGLSVYGIAIDKIFGGANRVIALNDYDHLCVYEETEKDLSLVGVFGSRGDLLWQSDEVFGGSNNAIEDELYQGPDKEDAKTYLNTRIITHDTNKDGKKEIIIVKNSSPTGRILEHVRIFTTSEIYNLSWDGLGMVENWRTRRTNGYVADYQFKDLDNDGQPEVVLALVQSVGLSIRSRSVVVAYRLTVPEGRQ